MAAFNPYGAPGHQYPHQRQVNDPWLLALVQAGEKFWQDRNVNYRLPVDLDVADTLGTGITGVGMRPDVYGQSRVIMNGRVAGRLLANARNKNYSVRGRRRNLQRLGQYVFHEVGHVGGLDHSKYGLMSSWGGDEVPWEARVLSHRLIRRKPQKVRRV